MTPDQERLLREADEWGPDANRVRTHYEGCERAHAECMIHLLARDLRLALAEGDKNAKDAERYRWLRYDWTTEDALMERTITRRAIINTADPAEIDAILDAALAARSGAEGRS